MTQGLSVGNYQELNEATRIIMFNILYQLRWNWIIDLDLVDGVRFGAINTTITLDIDWLIKTSFFIVILLMVIILFIVFV